MTGTVLATVRRYAVGLTRVMVNWISDAAGDATLVFDGREAPVLAGIIDRIVTRPSDGAPPSANYDFALYDRWGHDLLNGTGQNRSATAVGVAWPYQDIGAATYRAVMLAGGFHRLAVTNAGATKAGGLYIQLVDSGFEARQRPRFDAGAIFPPPVAPS